MGVLTETSAKGLERGGTVRAATSRFSYQILLSTLTNVILGVISVGTSSFVARLLGPQARGEWAAVQIWPTFVYVMSMMGLSGATVFYSSRDPELSGKYVGSALSLSFIASIPLILIAYPLIPILLRAQDPRVVTIAQWYLLGAVPLTLLMENLLQSLQGRHEFLIWNMTRLFLPAMWLVTLTLFHLLSWDNVAALAKGFLAGLFFTCCLLIGVIIRYIPRPFLPDTDMWKPMLAYGLPLMFSIVLQNLNLSSGHMILAATLPPESLGLYSVALSWGNIIPPLLIAIGSVTGPNIARLTKSEEQLKMVTRGTQTAFLISGSLGLLLLALTPFGMRLLFGAAFVAAIPIGFITVAAGAVTGLDHVLRATLLGLGRSLELVYAELVGMMATWILLLLLLNPFETLGAAIALLLGQTAILGYLIVAIRKGTHASLRELLLFRRRDLLLVFRQFIQLREPNHWVQ